MLEDTKGNCIPLTDINATFSGCKSLVNAPATPSSVIDLNNTFSGCTSLVNAPTIPSSVTHIGLLFQDVNH